MAIADESDYSDSSEDEIEDGDKEIKDGEHDHSDLDNDEENEDANGMEDYDEEGDKDGDSSEEEDEDGDNEDNDDTDGENDDEDDTDNDNADQGNKPSEKEGKKPQQKPKSKGKNNKVEPPKRKIGPQKQKKEIHTYLKKAKKFEIRKLTRRIAMLRNLKGTDEQKAKNTRKVEKLLLEIQAMKEFMIDQITERVVDIFKGTSEQIYLDIWTAAQDHKEFEKMLQKLSNGSDDAKYKNIAFLRMVSSKDIVVKLKMVDSGTNIKKPKSKKALKKQLRKYNQKNKKLKKLEVVTTTEKGDDRPVSDKSNEVPSDEKKSPSKKSNKGSENTNKDSNKKKQKKKKKVVDSFFLPQETAGSDDNDTDQNASSDEEFTAPVLESKSVELKKRNRMGQRARRQLVEKANAKTMGGNFNRKRGNSLKHSSSQHKRSKVSKENTVVVDEKLHPSWQAKQKQKQKEQQSITAFSGTKITFDD